MLEFLNAQALASVWFFSICGRSWDRIMFCNVHVFCIDEPGDDLLAGRVVGGVARASGERGLGLDPQSAVF